VSSVNAIVALTQGAAEAAVAIVALTQGTWHIAYSVQGQGNTTTAVGNFRVDNGVNPVAWTLDNIAPHHTGGGVGVVVAGVGGVNLTLFGQCTGVADDTFTGFANLVGLRVA
jgi:hypothetical protein